MNDYNYYFEERLFNRLRIWKETFEIRKHEVQIEEHKYNRELLIKKDQELSKWLGLPSYLPGFRFLTPEEIAEAKRLDDELFIRETLEELNEKKKKEMIKREEIQNVEIEEINRIEEINNDEEINNKEEINIIEDFDNKEEINNVEETQKVRKTRKIETEDTKKKTEEIIKQLKKLKLIKETDTTDLLNIYFNREEFLNLLIKEENLLTNLSNYIDDKDKTDDDKQIFCFFNLSKICKQYKLKSFWRFFQLLDKFKIFKNNFCHLDELYNHINKKKETQSYLEKFENNIELNITFENLIDQIKKPRKKYTSNIRNLK